jgi:hypothetical protein
MKRLFKIKICRSWFSDKFAVIRYSTNGIFWHTIKEYDYDYVEERPYFSNMLIYISDVPNVISRFKSLADIKNFEDEELKRVINHRKEISARNKKEKEQIKNIYKKYS